MDKKKTAKRRPSTPSAPEGIPIGDLFPGAGVAEVTGAETTLVGLQMGYNKELQEATANIGLVRAEVERLQAVIYILQGCIKATGDALSAIKEDTSGKNTH